VSRTRLESIGLVWHVTQMVICTVLLVGPRRTGLSPAGVWIVLMALFVPLAAGWWLAARLRYPTPKVLALAALYWATMAVAIDSAWIRWDFRMGISYHLPIGPGSPVSIDILAAASAALFAIAWRRRRLTIVGGVREA
jgi:hypothetical protein